MHRLLSSGASQTSSQPHQIGPRACQHSVRSARLPLLEQPFAARLFVAPRARRCYSSWGSIVGLAVARAAAAGVVVVVVVAAAAGDSGSCWEFRRVVGSTGQRLLAPVAPRLVSRAGAIGG